MLRIVPVTLAQANDFISRYHRHHKPITNGYRFCLGVADEDVLVGVAIVGNPLSQHLNDGFTVEVRRTCTDSTKNANSMLYGACWRAARAMGFRRMITYTMQSESGASLRAVGWACQGLHGGWDWNRPASGRYRQMSLVDERKYRWSISV